jgi:hypothetical protein
MSTYAYLPLGVERFLYYAYLGAQIAHGVAAIVIHRKNKTVDQHQANRLHFYYMVLWAIAAFLLFPQFPHLHKDKLYLINGWILVACTMVQFVALFIMTTGRTVSESDTIAYVVYKYGYDADLLTRQMKQYNLKFFPIDALEAYVKEKTTKVTIGEQNVECEHLVERYVTEMLQEFDVIVAHDAKYGARREQLRVMQQSDRMSMPYMEYRYVQELNALRDARKVTQ